MKKNRMMRSASALLVMVLLTTSVISGTFAKYTTQDSAEDSARVAKWGVTVQATGDLYASDYYSSSSTVTAADVDDEISVNGDQIAASLDVVAPGTKNEKGFSFAVNGKPEVSSQIALDITTQNIFLKKGIYGVMVKAGKLTEETYEGIVTESTVDGGLYTRSTEGVFTKAVAGGWNTATEYYTLEDYVNLIPEMYYPVVYSLSGEVEDNDGTIAADSLAELAFTLANKVNSGQTKNEPNAIDNITTYEDIKSAVFAPNTDLADPADPASLNLGKEVITWKWEFENGATDLEKEMYNGADTILGNLMAKRVGTPDYVGEVVKVGTEIKAPEEHTDYCLDTQFSIDITVTQVD